MSASAVSSTRGGDGLALGQQRLDGLDQRVAHGHGRARADRGIARDLHRGIAVLVRDQLRVDAQPLRQHRVEHGGVALAGRLHVEVQEQLLAAGKFQLGALERKAAGVLQHAGDADAAIHVALGRLAPALLEAVVVGELQRLVEYDVELAAVDGGADRGLVGHRLGLDQVAAAQLHGIDAGDARGLVHHALENVVRLRASGAAVGRGRRGVGEHAARGDVDQLDVVHAGQAAREVDGLDVGADRADIGAHAAEMADAQRENFPLLVERQLDIAVGVAGVVVAEEGLGAVRHPVHGAADLARRHQDGGVFRIGAGLEPERAADVLGGDAQALLGNAEDRRHSVAQRACALRAAAQIVALVRRIVARGGAARLHRMHHDALMDQGDLGDVLRRRHDALDLLGVGLGVGRHSQPVHRDVARRLRPDLRRTVAHRLAQVDRAGSRSS